MSYYNLLLNSSNVIGNNNSSYQYNFLTGNFVIHEDSEICVSQVSFPYSFFNLNKAFYTNTTFGYYFGSGTFYPITFQDGFYSTQDLFYALQNIMLANGHYLYDTATGQNVFYITLSTNQNLYSNQFLLYNIPSSLPTGYTNPSGLFPFNTNNYTPQVSFLSTSNFGSILGFTTGNYPSSLTTYIAGATSVISNKTPNATPVNALTIRCSLVNNDCGNPTDLLDSIPINNVSFGSNINYVPNYQKWTSVISGSYSNIVVYFQDQNLNNIPAQDPNVLISLMLRQGKKRESQIPKTIPQIIKSIEFKEPEE